MADGPAGGHGWRRWLLGGPGSWRRVVGIGLGGGVALAIIGALIAAAFTGGGSLDGTEATPVSSGDGVEEPVEEPDFVEPTDVPVIEEPTKAPVEEPLPTEPLPTEVIEEPTETPPIEEPTPIPTPLP